MWNVTMLIVTQSLFWLKSHSFRSFFLWLSLKSLSLYSPFQLHFLSYLKGAPVRSDLIAPTGSSPALDSRSTKVKWPILWLRILHLVSGNRENNIPTRNFPESEKNQTWGCTLSLSLPEQSFCQPLLPRLRTRRTLTAYTGIVIITSINIGPSPDTLMTTNHPRNRYVKFFNCSNLEIIMQNFLTRKSFILQGFWSD